MRECIDEGMLQSYFDGELSSEIMERVESHLASCLMCAHAARELERESLLLSEALEPEFAGSVPSERLRHRIEAAIAGLHVVHPASPGAPVLAGIRGWFQSIADLFRISPQRAFAYSGLAAVVIFVAVFALVHFKHGSSNKQLAIGAQKNSPTPVISHENPGQNDIAKAPQKEAPENPRQPQRTPKRRTPSPSESVAQVKLLPGERSYLKTIASLNTTIKSESNRPMRPALQAEYERNLALVDRAIAATRSAAKKNPNDPDAVEFMFSAYQSKVDLLNQVADSRLSNGPPH